MQVETEREGVVLRRFSLDDARAIFALIDESREHLSQHSDKTAERYPTLNHVVDSIATPLNPNKLRMGIWDREVLVGSINLTPGTNRAAEIGYYLGVSHVGRGYMGVAVNALTGYAFEHGFDELFARVEIGNDPSARVLERVGYVESETHGGKRYFSIGKSNS